MNGTTELLKFKHCCLFVFLLLAGLFSPDVQAQNRMADKPAQTTDSTRTVYSDIIYFSLNSGDWIDPSEYKKTGRLLRWALSDTITPINITGWTDPTGTEALNEQLSLRRARTVRNYLVSKGVAAERIRIEGRGVDTRAASNDEARRAEIAAVICLSAKSVPAEEERKSEEIAPDVVGKETEPVGTQQEIKEARQETKEAQQEIKEAQQETKEAQQETRDEIQETKEAQQETKDEQQPAEQQSVQAAAPQTSSRYLGVKTNLAAWAGTILNIAADVQVSEHISVELPLLWCPWYVGSKHAVKTFTLQPEARYWLSKPGEGHFFGLHAHAGWFSVRWNRDRYQDTDRPLLGAGISYGYLLPFNAHWAGEFTLGAGYANMKYDTYYNIDNGARIDTRTKNYWGITRVGISVVYRFNLKK